MGDEIHREYDQPDRVFVFFQAAVKKKERVRECTRSFIECRLPGPCLLHLVHHCNSGIVEPRKKHKIDDVANMLVHLSREIQDKTRRVRYVPVSDVSDMD